MRTVVFITCIAVLSACQQKVTQPTPHTSVVVADLTGQEKPPLHPAWEEPYCYTSKEVKVSARLLKDPVIHAGLKSDDNLRMVRDNTCSEEIMLFHTNIDSRDIDYIDSMQDDRVWKRIQTKTPRNVDAFKVTAALVDLHDQGL